MPLIMPNDPNSLFRQRAATYLKQVLDVACGPGALIISHSRFDTRKPFQEGDDYTGAYWRQALDDCWGPTFPKPSLVDWWYGENTLWVTGQLLWSQIIRYRLTKEPEALDVGRKCFRDLNHC